MTECVQGASWRVLINLLNNPENEYDKIYTEVGLKHLISMENN